MEFITMNLENPSQVRERVRENAKRLFAFETEYMAPLGFFQNANNSHLRDTAVSRIRRLAKTPGFQYDSFVQFHAVTYFDRCISSDRVQETNGLKNKLEDIKNMECRIRHMLNLKMESITALSFIDFFLSLIYDNDPVQIETAKANNGLYAHILFMHLDAEFVQFKPSIIAAVAIVAAITENGPVGDLYDPILRCKHVDTDEFEKCFDLLKSRLKPPPPPPPPTEQQE